MPFVQASVFMPSMFIEHDPQMPLAAERSVDRPYSDPDDRVEPSDRNLRRNRYRCGFCPVRVPAIDLNSLDVVAPAGFGQSCPSSRGVFGRGEFDRGRSVRCGRVNNAGLSKRALGSIYETSFDIV